MEEEKEEGRTSDRTLGGEEDPQMDGEEFFRLRYLSRPSIALFLSLQSYQVTRHPPGAPAIRIAPATLTKLGRSLIRGG